MNMKFLKGIVVGGLVTTGVMMMFSDNMNKNKMVKKGRQIAKRLGVM